MPALSANPHAMPDARHSRFGVADLDIQPVQPSPVAVVVGQRDPHLRRAANDVPVIARGAMAHRLELPLPPVSDPQGRRRLPVLGIPVDAITPAETVRRISAWAQRRESRYVCISNVHSIVTGTQDPAFCQVLSRADLVTPDGAPVAWMLRRQGQAGQRRVNGPDLMWDYFAHASEVGDSVFLLGSDPDTLARLLAAIERQFPSLRVAGAVSPPFRELTAEEDEALVQQINASGAGTVWVSLGCPKQESWMAAHRDRIRAVQIGVGAAFGFHAGTVKRAPRWMRENGMEWVHRLCSEPRRLWKRYLTTNCSFAAQAVVQLLR